MQEQLSIQFDSTKEDPPKEKKAYELLYSLMAELYDLTNQNRIKGIKYYVEDDINYCEIIGTEKMKLQERIKIYQEVIRGIKNGHTL